MKRRSKLNLCIKPIKRYWKALVFMYLEDKDREIAETLGIKSEC
jgi:hypothetical protein